MTVNRELASYIRRRNAAGDNNKQISQAAHVPQALIAAVLSGRAAEAEEYGRITWRSPVCLWPIQEPELRAMAGRLVTGKRRRDEPGEWRRWVVWCNFVSSRFYRPTDAPQRV